MTRRRFYVPRDAICEGVATLPPSQAHHLRDVLRLKTGDVAEIFDGEGSGYSGTVDLYGSEVLIRNLESIPSIKSPFHIVLAAALVRSAKYELVLQKATELGVHEIVPLNSRHSEIQIPANKVDARLERWRRIVQEAAKQCRRVSTPILHEPLDFPDFVAACEPTGSTRILFYEKALDLWRHENDFTERVILCIGPEGGWDQSEVDTARESGFGVFSLGPWTLRAETAAIAALSIVQHQLHLLSS